GLKCAVLGKCSVWGKREFWLPDIDRPADGERTVRGRLGRRATVSERRRSFCPAGNAAGFPRPEFPGLWQAKVGFLRRRPQVCPPNAIAARGERRRLRSQDRLRCRCREIPADGGISALCAEREWQSAEYEHTEEKAILHGPLRHQAAELAAADPGKPHPWSSRPPSRGNLWRR